MFKSVNLLTERLEQNAAATTNCLMSQKQSFEKEDEASLNHCSKSYIETSSLMNERGILVFIQLQFS